MSDNQSLLESDLRLSSRGPSQSNIPATFPTRLKPRRVIIQMIIFNFTSLAFMAIHFTIFTWQNGKPVQETIPQNLSTALANFLAIVAEISLLGGIGIAYERILRSISYKRPVFGLENILRTLNSSPWNLVRPRVLVWIIKVRELWIVSLFCAGIPFAIVFPPGALTVEFENAVSTALHNVPTMNISDYGNGTWLSFSEKILLDGNSYLEGTPLRPSLDALASQVLSSGKHVRLDSPCGSSCEYTISIEGPRFHCRHVSLEEALIEDCMEATYTAEDQRKRSSLAKNSRAGNSFKISWYPGRCIEKSVAETIDCTTTLARYNIHINNSRDASQLVTVKIDNDREFWNDTAYIETEFTREKYFHSQDKSGLWLTNDTIRANFTNMQAFAISRGAVNVLEGFAKRLPLSNGLTVIGDGRKALNSPYIGVKERADYVVNITTEAIEKFLEDVVISTISLGMSTHNGVIEAVVGSEVYKFEEKVQFFAGYGSCLAVSLCISIFSYFCMAQSRKPSGPILTRAVPLQRFEALG